MGMFSSAGVCALVWGPEILNTALGSPPVRTHPAFWVFLALTVPSMLIGSAGAFFAVVLPLYSYFDLRILGKKEPDLSLIQWYIRVLERVRDKLKRNNQRMEADAAAQGDGEGRETE